MMGESHAYPTNEEEGKWEKIQQMQDFFVSF